MAYDENDAYEGFDSEIGEEANAGGFVLLPPGDYPFEVVKMDKERYNGSDSIPPCWQATVTLRVDGGDLGKASVIHRLYMTRKQSWKLKQFFVGLGLVDASAEKFTPPWNQIYGKAGAVTLSQHEYNGKTYNDVDKVLDPARAAEVAAKALAAAPKAAATPPWGN